MGATHLESPSAGLGESGLPGVRIVRNRGFRSNSYVLELADSRCLVIDPGLDEELMAAELAESGLSPVAILITHGHFDHIGGAAALQRRFGVPVHMERRDVKTASMSNFLLAAFKLGRRIELPDFSLIEADVALEVGGKRATFWSVAGHTPGSTAIAIDDLLFTGDSLYARHIGLSKLPGEDPGLLRASLRRLLSLAGDQVRVLPGHGGHATVAEIRSHNLELRAFMMEDSL
ncbi:MAG TPA: MBL fold metallo-hydrolase [Myxococcota bacterium]|nr:MBL fold metallo-hydrolase [Myxococcota bacterium]